MKLPFAIKLIANGNFIQVLIAMYKKMKLPFAIDNYFNSKFGMALSTCKYNI